MLKRALIRSFLIMIFAPLVLAMAPLPAKSINLKHNSVVTGSTITLGDIFDGLERDEDRVLGASPRPGDEMILNARTLMRVAIAMDLPWRPTSTADYVVITRAATYIDRNKIENALRSEIKYQGYDGKFKIQIPNMSDEIILPQDLPDTVEVQTLRLYQDRDYFEATIVAPSADRPIKTARITGKLVRVVDIPVLSETLRNGEIIGKRDLKYIEIEERNVQHDMIVNANDLIGMTPRRMVLQDKPITATSIESPRMVQRGDMVTMTFKEGLLNLSARGRALQDGAKGDIIRVVNMSSNRTIEAEVSASREVVVSAY